MDDGSYCITIKNVAYKFELSDSRLYYIPKQGKNISTYGLNNDRIETPQVLVITRKNGIPLFALEPDKNDEKQFAILTAQQLYDDLKYQWFEPLADNYRKLIWLNEESFIENSEAYSAYKHFTWDDIIKFALKDRMMIAYYSGLWGDWKKRKKGGAEYLLVMVNKKPYWTDAIGQIPFSVDCMRDNIIKCQGNYDMAIKQTILTGMKWGDGEINGEEDNTNSYDNHMILRGCLWSRKKFSYREKKNHDDSVFSIVEEISGNFEEILESKITEEEMDAYAQWKYQK